MDMDPDRDPEWAVLPEVRMDLAEAAPGGRRPLRPDPAAAAACYRLSWPAALLYFSSSRSQQCCRRKEQKSVSRM